MTNAIPAVYAAIAAITGELAHVGITKNRTNSHDNYKFRGIEDVYNTLAPLLAKHELVILPRTLNRESVERVSNKGTAMFYVTLHVEFDFVSAKDGSRHTVAAHGEAMDRSDKATNKAMSAAYKYACFLAFCIPTEAQDADFETPEVEPVSDSAAAKAGDFAAAMNDADTPEALDAVAGQLKAASLPAPLLRGLRELYATRKAALTKAAA